MTRFVHWMRKERPSTLTASFAPLDGKPVVTDGMASMGFVHVHDKPLYDNDTFYVIDTVKDVEFAVGGPGGIIRTAIPNKYEAIEWADDFKAAWERNPPLSEEQP